MRMFKPAMMAMLLAGIFGNALIGNDEEKAAGKKALQELGEFVGQWKGDGEVKGEKKGWKETMEWSWQIKDEGFALKMTVKDGKLTEGVVTFDPKKKQYKMTAKDSDGKEAVYEGELKRKILTFTRTDDKGDKYTITMSTNNMGARMIYDYRVQAGGKGLEKELFKVVSGKEGASIAGGGKKNERVVTGGLGTMQVSYMGKTYYVCCSGCKDAFEANPKKYVEEFEKSKKK